MMMQVFDFEAAIKSLLSSTNDERNPDREYSAEGGSRASKVVSKHRTVVCRHWLLGLCAHGTSCDYLHRIDRSKAPVCKYGKLCKIKNCQLKHVDEMEIMECIFFKQGFCYNGPGCVRRHIKRSPDECPKEASFEQAITIANGIINPQFNKKIKSSQRNENYKVSLCSHWLMTGTCHFNDECHFAHGEDEIGESMIQSHDNFNDLNIYDPGRNIMDPSPNVQMPFDAKVKVAYFLCQAPDLRSLDISRRKGAWAVSTRIAPEINAAFRACDYAILFMCVRPLKGIYGMVKVMGPIPPSLDPLSPITPEFPVMWMRMLRLSLRTVAQLKINQSGMFVGRQLTDAKFDVRIGYEVMTIYYRKPLWDWTQEIMAAEEGIMRSSEDEVAALARLPPDVLFSEYWVERVANSFATVDRKKVESGTLVTSGAGADFYTLDFPGFIFNASQPVVDEMFGRGMFGLPAQMKDVVIHLGAPLFLYDPQPQLLFGIFQAASLVTENLDPAAFKNWQLGPAANMQPSMLPLQVKFTIVLDAPPIHVMKDPEFRAIFKDNPVLGGQIGLKETKLLANLIAVRSGVVLVAGNQTSIIQQIPVTGMYKPAFKNIEVVPISVAANIFDVKKRLLGNNASVVLQLCNEVTAGNPKSVRIRMRGIGSGYLEGPQQKELQEPLHFNVCADTEDLLRRACEKVNELICKVRYELTGNKQ